MEDTGRAIFFWKPDQEYGYLGQWFSSQFVSNEPDGRRISYENAEQYMMHRKGLLFAPDHEVTADILLTLDPHEIKALGRAVPNFHEDTWRMMRYNIVVEGNYLKFSQNEELKKLLLATCNRELVEASPRDRIWGVGFGWKRAEEQRSKWGLNLLGKALMEVRMRIREESLFLRDSDAVPPPVPLDKLNI